MIYKERRYPASIRSGGPFLLADFTHRTQWEHPQKKPAPKAGPAVLHSWDQNKSTKDVSKIVSIEAVSKRRIKIFREIMM